MSSRKTFLHYLTSSADPETTAKFQRVLADQADDFEKLVRDINKHDEKFKPTYDKKPSFWDKMLAPDSKSPLDLEPEELDNLIKVHRDPTSQINFDFKMLAENMDPPIGATQVSGIVAQFWKANEDAFDSTNDIQFDPKTLDLHFQGKKKLAEELLKKLHIKPSLIEDVLAGRYSKNRELGQVQFEVPLTEESLAKKIEPTEIDDVIKHFYDMNEANFNSPEDITYDDAARKLFYLGPKSLARQLLNELGVKSEFIEKALKTNKKTHIAGDPATKKASVQGSPIQFEVAVNKQTSAPALTRTAVERAVNRFYKAHQDEFGSKNDITFDITTQKLKFRGSRKLATQLLESLRVKQPVIDTVLNPPNQPSTAPALPQDFFSVHIPIDDLGLDSDETDNALAAWLVSKGKNEKTAHLNKDKDALLFTGNEDLLDSLLSTRGLRLGANQIDRILQNLNNYKIKK
jgi:hypothetical protein